MPKTWLRQMKRELRAARVVVRVAVTRPGNRRIQFLCCQIPPGFPLSAGSICGACGRSNVEIRLGAHCASCGARVAEIARLLLPETRRFIERCWLHRWAERCRRRVA